MGKNNKVNPVLQNTLKLKIHSKNIICEKPVIILKLIIRRNIISKEIREIRIMIK
jgi:hypothetical protein